VLNCAATNSLWTAALSSAAFSSKQTDQRVLWPSTVYPSQQYFQSLGKHAVPLDIRVVAVLASSSMALDIYACLAQRLHRVPPGDPDFMDLLQKVTALIPPRFGGVLYEGNASWLGAEDDDVPLLGPSDDLTIWKLCFYGSEDYAFGLRVPYASHFVGLPALHLWDRIFQVPPHGHVDFIGFEVGNDTLSLNRIALVVRTINQELAARQAALVGTA
jgi:hypothetical protein